MLSALFFFLRMFAAGPFRQSCLCGPVRYVAAPRIRPALIQTRLHPRFPPLMPFFDPSPSADSSDP